MNLFLRVYAKNSFLDYPLNDRSIFTIGSGKEDDSVLNLDNIKEKQVVLKKMMGVWYIESSYPMVYQKTMIKKKKVEVNDIFYLSSKDKIYLYFYDLNQGLPIK